MTLNLSGADRKVRLALAGILLVLIVFGILNGVAAWIAGALALILGATSVVGFCPLYRAIGFSSLPRRRR